jgi:hypothetical protein
VCVPPKNVHMMKNGKFPFSCVREFSKPLR